MRAVKLTGYVASIIVLAVSSAVVHAQQKPSNKPRSTINTMPETGSNARDRSASTALTKGECRGLGGKVVVLGEGTMMHCLASGKATCIVVDSHGRVHRECINESAIDE